MNKIMHFSESCLLSLDHELETTLSLVQFESHEKESGYATSLMINLDTSQNVSTSKDRRTFVWRSLSCPGYIRNHW